MIRRWGIYLLVLGAALLFQIVSGSYLAQLFLSCVLALPVLSLLLSLPGMLTCRIRLSAEPGVMRRAEDGAWMVRMENVWGLPLARLQLWLEERSLFTGRTDRFTLSLSGAVRRRPLEEPAYNEHCGVLELRCTRVMVQDLLGLIPLPCALPQPARLLVAPYPLHPGRVEIPEADPGEAAPDEDGDLREYRPGEPAVRWKLSSKWEELISSGSGALLPLFTLDHFGDPDGADQALDRLVGLSRSMLSAGRPHAVLWLDPSGGEPCRCAVLDAKDLQRCVVSILSQPCPPQGPSILDRPELISAGAARVFHLHVTAQGEEGYGE